MLINHSNSILSNFASSRWTDTVNNYSKLIATNCISIAIPLISFTISSFSKMNKSNLKDKIKKILTIKDYRAVNRTKKIGQSLLSQIILGSIRENILEYLGYSLGSIVGQKLIGKIGGVALCSMANMVGSTVFMLAGSNIIIEVIRKPIDVLTLAKILTIIAITGLTIYAIPKTLAESGNQLGTFFGNTLGEIIGGLLGGFVAIHLNGSYEPLFSLNKNNPNKLNDLSKGYVFKTIQCMVFFAIRDHFLYKSLGGLSGFIADLTLGSLVYNILDIVDIIKCIINGTLLNNSLPKKINIARFLHEYDKLFEQEYYWQTSEISPLISSLYNPLDITKQWKIHHKELLNELIVIYIRLTNNYAKIIFSDANILDLQRGFNIIFVKWMNEKDKVKKQQYIDSLKVVKKDLSNAIEEKIKLYKLNFLSKDKEDKIIKNDFIKDIFDNKLKNKNIDHLSEIIINEIKSLEEEIIGFSVTFDEIKIYLQKMLKLHAKNITMLLNSSLDFTKLNKEEMQKFYLNISHLIVNHYSLIFPFKMNFINKLLNNQILNLEFREFIF